jgi:hypothetical protein
MELNNLLVNSDFYPRLKVGQTKSEIEAISGIELGSPDIETEDVNYYELKMKTGLCLIVIFDKTDICFEIRLDIDKNQDIDFKIREGDNIRSFNANIHFDTLIDILTHLNSEWEFDKAGTYLQTVCIHLSNGLRLYYAFGDKGTGDYGFFSIKSILEGHCLT